MESTFTEHLRKLTTGFQTMLAQDEWVGLDTMSEFEQIGWGLFSWRGKMRRRGVLGHLFAQAAVFAVVFVVLLLVFSLVPQLSWLGSWVLFFCYLGWVACLHSLAVRRLRSAGYSVLWAAILFVPGANGYLLYLLAFKIEVDHQLI